MRVLNRLTGLALAAAAASLFPPHAVAQARDEYQVKAAFLYNFAKFVEWPPEAFHSPAQPIAVCVLGQNPFGHWLTDTIGGKSIDGRPLVVLPIAIPADVTACQIVFVGSSEPKHVWTELAALHRQWLLTIGETDEARRGGSIVTFQLEEGRVRFEINTEAADLGKVRISSRLLSLAHLVHK